jgi:alpha-tubulin suppressor-like RCC1 family protein
MKAKFFSLRMAVPILVGLLSSGSTIAPAFAATAPYGSVVAGGTNSCADYDGGVRCWGSNDYPTYQLLGNAAFGDVASATDVVSLEPGHNAGASILAQGRGHTCTIVNGGLKCWGNNGYGQLGDGTTTYRTEAVWTLPAGSGVSAVSVGWNHTCAVQAGVAKCWGYNSDGQLGNGTKANALSPTPVSGVTGYTDIAAGESHTCGVLSGGVYCWGKNGLGQLGTGDNMSQTSPVGLSALPANSGVVRLTAGSSFTCAVVAGSAQCWGDNAYGQLGIGNAQPTKSPQAVVGLGSGVSVISAGQSHTCAAVNQGVQCWGRNQFGQLGIGNVTDQKVPVLVSGLSGAIIGLTDVAAGVEHSCARYENQIYCWGRTNHGQLGNGDDERRLKPVNTIAAGSQISAIAVGGEHGCAGVGSQIQCWGNNDFGQLATGNKNESLFPTSSVGSVTGLIAITAGTAHTCAVGTGATTFCWGENNQGQLGTDYPNDHTSFVAPLSQSQWTGAGDNTSCSVHLGGVRCWGANNYGQTGSGAVSGFVSAPQIAIPDGAGAVVVASSGYHACAVVNGGVKCWGYNASGQLGNGTKVDSSVPVDAIAPNLGATAISTGLFHTCAIVNGGVQCWGGNGNGQLGSGNENSSLVPITTTFFAGKTVTSIAASENYSCAVADQAAYCWGKNDDGQLGIGTTDQSSLPVLVAGIGANITGQIAAAPHHACVVAFDGVRCWGSNYRGRLGIASPYYRSAPQPVEVSDEIYKSRFEIKR